MKKLLLFIILFFPVFIFGQPDRFICHVEHSTPLTPPLITDRSYFGYQFTPRGEFKVLLVQ